MGGKTGRPTTNFLQGFIKKDIAKFNITVLLVILIYLTSIFGLDIYKQIKLNVYE